VARIREARMRPRIVSVTFETDAQTEMLGRFSIPQSVCRILAIRPGSKVNLRIQSALGNLDLTAKLSSGSEIYGPKIRKHVSPGERITVTASR
jgi:hypothetical protein